MAFNFLKSVAFLQCRSPYFGIPRYIRGSRRGEESKLVKGSVKKVTNFDDDQFEIPSTYRDLVESVKSSTKLDDIDIEEALNSTEDFGDVINAKTGLDHKDKLKDKDYRKFVKEKIIRRKYFKLDLESTLLTIAAKNQIHYLHDMDPLQWNPETLAQSFPITVSGVKKLLKNKFVLTSPEKIQQHDALVAERWEHLQSGVESSLITPYTQRMWDEGRIMKNHYNGNPNLPNSPPVHDKTIIHQEVKKVGEFSSIIQQYAEYKKNKDTSQSTLNTSDQAICKVDKNSVKSKTRLNSVLKSKNYHIDDEEETTDHFTSTFRLSKRKSIFKEDGELIHSQFKQNLNEEMSCTKSNSDPRYSEWMKQQQLDTDIKASPKPVNSKELFSKISKFNREAFELKKDASKGKSAYYYDDKHGYQYPVGKIVKSKIRLPNNSLKKGVLYKVGQTVYDEDGEFLYKVPK